jgi:hypothetical protein
MSTTQTSIVVLVALLAGFLGGVVAQQAGGIVLAQAGPVKQIEAQEFRLVDAKGRLLGLIKAAPSDLSAEDGEPAVMVPRDGRGAGGGAIMLFDTLGRATWTAPEPIDPPARVRPLTKIK